MFTSNYKYNFIDVFSGAGGLSEGFFNCNFNPMLELVRFQKKQLKQVAGAEEVIYSATEMLRMEKRNSKKLGAVADLPVYSIPYTQVKKIAAIKNHIWGL